MVRMFLTVVAISFVAGTFPASAQGGGGRETWCRANRCNGGYMSGNAPKCMIQLCRGLSEKTR